jgi:hypothetical protein
MPGPVPGMDPFLKGPDIWPGFHRQMVAALYQGLLPRLSERYRARLRERCYTTGRHLGASGAGDERSAE